MRELSKAVLALCLLDSERPVQRKASLQSCLNFDMLSRIHGPTSLTVRTKPAVLRATCSQCPLLDRRLEVDPVLSKRLDQTSCRGLFQHKLYCDSTTVVQRRNDKQKSKSQATCRETSLPDFKIPGNKQISCLLYFKLSLMFLEKTSTYLRWHVTSRNPIHEKLSIFRCAVQWSKKMLSSLKSLYFERQQMPK